MISEKEVSYQSTNTYSTRNELTDKTKNIWIVFHGMGYLSRYFINYFSGLDPVENYIIAPQAPSKYYMDKAFKHIGASWLTREKTMTETQNVLRYIDAVVEKEITNSDAKLFVLGYSQGVSIAARWLASRKINCDHLILYSGGIPKELTPNDFSYLKASSKVTYLYGNKDPYITEARKTEEQLRGAKLFENRLKIEVFDGVHEIHRDFLLKVSKEK